MGMRYIAASFIVMMVLVPTVGAQSDHALLREIHETIATIPSMTGPPSMVRTDAAEHLSDLTKQINPREVDDKTLSHIASLLDTSDDSVRFWVAIALGNLGHRARVTAPKLLKILPR